VTSSHKTPTQPLQRSVKPKGISGFWEAGLGKYITLAPGAVAKDDWNSLFKRHFSLSVAKLSLCTSGINALHEQSCRGPMPTFCGCLGQDYNGTVVWRAFGRMQRFSIGDKPATS